MTGKLVDDVAKPLGRDHYSWKRCVDCGTVFPVSWRWGAATCNGAPISCCPWCRPDSKPWQAGRGL